jgi:hypothetical protein
MPANSTVLHFFLEKTKMCLVQLLLLLSGDVELNPGPPKRAPAAKASAKEPTKEETMASLEIKVSRLLCWSSTQRRHAFAGRHVFVLASKGLIK